MLVSVDGVGASIPPGWLGSADGFAALGPEAATQWKIPCALLSQALSIIVPPASTGEQMPSQVFSQRLVQAVLAGAEVSVLVPPPWVVGCVGVADPLPRKQDLVVVSQ